MTSLLRQTGSLAGISKSVLRNKSRQSLRPSLIPISYQALFRSRHYATTNEPEKPDNQKDKKAVEPSAKSAPGTEYIYNSSSSPMSTKPSASDEKGSSPPEPVLSAEDEKALQNVLAIAKKYMPASQQGVIERIAFILRREGIPPELRPMMDKTKTGKSLALSDTMNLAKFAANFSKRLADEDLNKSAEDQKSNKTDFKSNAPKSEKDDKQKTDQKKSDSPFSLGGADLSTTVAGAFVMYIIFEAFSPGGAASKDITWQEFRTTFLDKGLVEKLTVEGGDRVRVDLHRDLLGQMYADSPATNPNFHYYFSIGSIEAFERRLDQAQHELQIPSHERIPVTYAKRNGRFMEIFLTFAPTLLFMGMLFALSRRSGGGSTGGAGGIFSMGKSRAKRFNHDAEVKVKFKDVAGMDEAKMEIMEFVAFLKTPEQFQRLGAKIPRGAILSGPPGTGKTLLAKATAGESGVPFFSVSGSEFVEMFVGVGASRVRDLFATARKNTPCIIFIDEIDAIGKARSKGNFGGGNDEREATLNQILTEMDGFNTSEQVVVLAGTNRSDVLDKALMRPGRFDRHIAIDRPTMDGRKQIFKVHLGKIVTNEDIEYLTGRLAALTPGFSGADIANCVNEAALIAARTSAQSVAQIHFEQAIERVIGGLEKKSLVLNPEERKTVAYHEAGHAICGWYFKYADPLLKVSIIPRGQGALGYAQYLPAGDSYLMNVKQLMDRMAMTLGGRVSEELHFETVTSGASDDFMKVTRLATAMVTQWGMSSKLGPLHFPESDDKFNKPFAESTAQTIDSEVRRIVDEAYKQCKDLLIAKKAEIGIVAEELLSKEVLGREDMIRLLGPRPFEDNKEFSKYFGGGISAPLPPPTEPDTAPPPGAQVA